MKFFTKQRVVILSSLAAVILVLTAIIISYEIIGSPEASTPVDTVPAHSAERDARVGLAAMAEWETNFGGSGDESPVSSFTINGKPYIFGNTTSSDLDFPSGGGTFGARLSGYGRTEKFATYGGAGSTLQSASLLENGFALTVNGETDSAVFIDFELNTLSTLNLSAPESCSYDIVDVGAYGNNLFIFRQSSGAATEHTVCDIVSKSGTLVGQKIFKQSLNLAYRGFFPGNTLVTVFAETSATAGCVLFAEWTVSGNTQYKRTVTAAAFDTLAVFPAPSGWLVLRATGGETFASFIDQSYSLIRSVNINFAGVRRGELFYSSATSSFYASVYVEGEINGLFSIDAGITKATRVSLPSYSSMYLYGTSTGDVLALTSAETIMLTTLTSSGAATKQLTDYSKSPVITRSGDNWFVTFAAKEKAAIIGDNYGGYDVAVVKVKF